MRRRGHPQGRLLREATECIQTYECHPQTTTRSETQYTLYTLVSKKPHKVTELLSIMEDNNFTGAAGKHFYFIILNLKDFLLK